MTTEPHFLQVYPASLVVAQSIRSPTVPVLIWAGCLIVVALVGGMVILWVRGRMVGSSMKGADAAAGLSGLRSLRDSGQMSQEEYDAARKSLAHKVAGRAPPRPAGVPRQPAADDPEIKVAKPGFDLTGAPLPKPKRPPPPSPRPGAAG